MMHINLIRARKGPRLAANDRPLVAMAAVVVVAVVGMFLLTASTTSEADRLVRANNSLKDGIERLKNELGDYEKVKAQRQDLLKQQKAIDLLKSGRTGPVYVMRELSEILTPHKGPTIPTSASTPAGIPAGCGWRASTRRNEKYVSRGRGAPTRTWPSS
jgi:Tfp pilus assembly protein PilN